MNRPLSGAPYNARAARVRDMPAQRKIFRIEEKAASRLGEQSTDAQAWPRF